MDFSLLFLDGAGAALQSEAADELRVALSKLDECLASLEEQQGIGETFCIWKVQELRDKVERYRKNLLSLPTK